MKQKLLRLFLVILGLGILIAILLFLLHAKFSCPILKYFKIYCPGCGLTRMILSFIHGNFYQAFRYNPLIFVLLPFVFLLLFDFIFQFISKKENYLIKKIPNKFWYSLLGIVLLFTILRNIPMFSFLLPTMV